MRLTQTKKKAFCCVLADTCNVSLAAKTIEVNRSTPYKWRKQDPEFAIAWDESLEKSKETFNIRGSATPTNNQLLRAYWKNKNAE